MAAMAVKDESLHHATESLILAKPRKYYRATIETTHWQLRSLISSPTNGTIYFPSGTDIIAINTKTRDREVVATLPFYPRCLTASKDWICCGGDHGNYAAISLKEKESSFDSFLNLDADPDARLPLNLDPSSRSILRDRSTISRRSRSRPKLAEPIKVGSEIVNCVTLWHPESSPVTCAYSIPVAVVANNDNSVSILNLESSEILEKITFPDCVNRSVLSPDGVLLATIGDDPFLYIHERKLKKSKTTERMVNFKVPAIYEWELSCKIQLEGQRHADKSQMRGSFAACFSKSGKYLAVATQYGLISIFDVENITHPDSLLLVFTTSRPGPECGAVRAMEFSPGPFDLLAWTESTGRVGVADVRAFFNSRQLILMSPKGEGVERVTLVDRQGESVIDPRLRSFRTESPSSSTPDYLGLDIEPRYLRHLTREMLDRHQNPLTIEELEVLHAHRIARRQRDAANAARETLAEASSTSRWGPSPWAEAQRSSASPTTGEGPGSTSRRIGTTGLPTALREFVNPDRTAASFRTFIQERNRENERRETERRETERRHQPQEPRRRSSMILAAAENAIERETLGARNANDTSTTLERLTLAGPRRLESTASDASPNPWAETAGDILFQSRIVAEPQQDRSTRLRIEIEEDEPRDFAHRLRQPWGVEGLLGLRDENAALGLAGPLRAEETTGCVWSEDGRVLYAGAMDGIYEYHVNLEGRKRFPSLVLQ